MVELNKKRYFVDALILTIDAIHIIFYNVNEKVSNCMGKEYRQNWGYMFTTMSVFSSTTYIITEHIRRDIDSLDYLSFQYGIRVRHYAHINALHSDGHVWKC